MSMHRGTHTYVTMEISPEAYADIRKQLEDAGYQHHFMPNGEIDMTGIAVLPDPKRGGWSEAADIKKAEDVKCQNSSKTS